MNKGMARKIGCWFTTRDDYDAPELGPRIVGTREGETKQVRTATVVEVDGRFVKTASGSVYELGDADPDFVRHLEASGYAFDPENPIRLLRSLAERTELPPRKPLDRTLS